MTSKYVKYTWFVVKRQTFAKTLLWSFYFIANQLKPVLKRLKETTSWPLPYVSLKTCKMATHSFGLFTTKKRPQILSQLWFSLFDCGNVVYTVRQGWKGRSEEGSVHFWLTGSLVSFEFSDHRIQATKVKGVWGSLQIPKHRGGAWDGTIVRYEKRKTIARVCTLDCKWGLDILYGV